ncbi:cAMP-specific 3',5'-cyclic phosphodiesterase 4D [Protobothrops mucrosquamatus]|uniref:cAMP-specific 3',5'-cyclic phosphodiesterase 4D n=1 Tax=Protobothrops mucrosquamatus TaxID=103944 RepID=UPI000775F2A5|nr:cAMP-specific 3',5'-cyclic phosphodiesterase 4D [Protobothrops mucrosquamatus]
MSRDTNSLSVRSKSASEETLYHQNEEETVLQGTDQYRVRRLSCRNLQLPPLAFRQLEQVDWEKKTDPEMVQRPTNLPLRTLPLIAITAADTVRVQKYEANPAGHFLREEECQYSTLLIKESKQSLSDSHPLLR